MQITPIDQNAIRSSSATSVASRRFGKPPVFLHTTWRSGGTWLWSRFCAVPQTAGLYEPLHEGLRTLRPHQLGSLHASVWESGHPPGHERYFECYRPLLQVSGGVAGFPEDEGPQRFFAPEDAALPELEAYVTRLLQMDGTPVLKFCRSAGRLGWMRRHFPAACHVMLTRNPASQWASMQRQRLEQGNTYFTSMPAKLLQACRHQPAVARAMEAMRSGGAHSADEGDYRAFLVFWLLTTCFEVDEGDLVLNLDLLATSQPYRASCEYEVLAATGLAVDLAGVRPTIATRLDPAWLGLPRMAVVRCHQDAMDYVLAAGLTDAAASRVAGALCHATSLVLGRSGAATASQAARWQADEGDDAMRAALRIASRRAIEAEAQLRNIEASRCWALTEPLRRWGQRVKGLRRGSVIGQA